MTMILIICKSRQSPHPENPGSDNLRLVTKFNLVMPAREALLRDVKSVKQSLRNTHYQVELGNELNPENLGSDCLPLLMPAIFYRHPAPYSI